MRRRSGSAVGRRPDQKKHALPFFEGKLFSIVVLVFARSSPHSYVLLYAGVCGVEAGSVTDGSKWWRAWVSLFQAFRPPVCVF